MTSSQSFPTVEPLISFRSSFDTDPWLLPDIFSHENDLLNTGALHISIPVTTDCPSSTSSATLGLEPEITTAVAAVTKRKRGDGSAEGNAPAPKRKSRPTSRKKSQTTFIKADPENFRQMVQQATGGGAHNGPPNPLIVKPQPLKRPVAAAFAADSDSLSSHHYHHQEESLVVSEALYGPYSRAGPESEAYPVFPTLESWTVM